MSSAARIDQPAADELLYEVRDGIGTITFNRPQARNAMTFAMYERMAEICAEIDADPSIKALILTGAGGKAFAAGTDISQFRAFKTPEDAIGYESRIDRVLGALERCRVPTIAAIPASAPAAGSASPRAATCASPCRTRNSASRSPARSATACRWATTPAWRR
jgi:enoyl-CoA hydratase/carnithine racemase